MSSIPEEIDLQILLRVPVKSTFVCKCVCRSWFSLISDPDFVTMHLEFTPHRNNSKNLILGGSSCGAIYSLSYEPSLWEKNKFKLSQLYYPYISSRYAVELLGSCNGLVCLMLHVVTFSAASTSNVGCLDFFFCIWNPATHEYKNIYEPPNKIAFYNIKMYVFGYDHKNDDYKLVIGLKLGDASSVVQIYTLGSDSWGSVMTVPYKFYSKRKSGVLVNGGFHWLAYERQRGRLIVSLDISEERFKEMELSTELEVELKEDGHCFTAQTVWEGCLGMLVGYKYNNNDSDDDDENNNPGLLEVWVMEDYGVRESWTRRYIITHRIITRKIMPRSFSLRFMWSSKNGQILITDWGKLVLYDPEDGSAVERDMGNGRGFGSEADYIESLVSVNPGTYAGIRQTKGSIEAEERRRT